NQGKRDLAENQAKQARDAFARVVRDNLDDHPNRFRLIECLVLLGEFPAASEALQTGATLAQQRPEVLQQYAKANVRLLIAWSDSKAADAKAQTERFQLIEEAVKIDPTNPDVLQRLLGFLKQSGPEAEKARKTFADLTASGKPSAVAHLFLGIDAWQADNTT